MSIHRRQLPLTITLLAGILTVFVFFFKIKETDLAAGTILNWSVLISAFAVCLGAAASFLANVTNIRKRKKDWYLNAWLIIVMFIFIVIGVVGTARHPTYEALYNAVIPMVSTGMWGLVGASTVSAAVRCFRLKSMEGALVLIPAVILILMYTPIWDAVWGGFSIAGKWILDVPSAAGNRGYILAAAIGAIALSLRMLIGRELGYLGRD